MLYMKKIIQTIASVWALAAILTSCTSTHKSADTNRTAETITVKVAVVYEDPIIPGTDGKRLHEVAKTPGYSFSWNNPKEQVHQYEAALEEASHGVVDYVIVAEYDAKQMFALNSNTNNYLTVDTLVNHIFKNGPIPGIAEGVAYDYIGMIKHYGFDKMRDKDELHEVWVFNHPACGMYESRMIGDNAFWINSPGITKEQGAPCKELLSVMFCSYERNLACALESYSHRFESTMMKVYGWWDYENRATKADLTTWDKYTGYAKIYDKYEPGMSHVGNVHFPPNGTHDYDFTNDTKVMSYADEWLYDYPEIKEKNARLINHDEWGDHTGYMKWWLGHMPHFKGISPYDNKLNNWWHYVVNYNAAVALEKELNK